MYKSRNNLRGFLRNWPKWKLYLFFWTVIPVVIVPVTVYTAIEGAYKAVRDFWGNIAYEWEIFRMIDRD